VRFHPVRRLACEDVAEVVAVVARLGALGTRAGACVRRCGDPRPEPRDEVRSSSMIEASCHCGAIRIEIPRKPRTLTSCNGSMVLNSIRVRHLDEASTWEFLD
jgi:hypothetical protein